MKTLTIAASDVKASEESLDRFRSYLETCRSNGLTTHLLNYESDKIIFLAHIVDGYDDTPVVREFYDQFRPGKYTVSVTPIPEEKPNQRSK